MNSIKRTEKLFYFVKDNIVVIFILLLAFSIRFYGINYSYPFGVNYIWDEINGITYLFDVLQSGNMFSTSSQYPLFLPLVYLPVLALRLMYIGLREGLYDTQSLKNYLVEFGVGNAYIIIRWYGVFFGTATVYVVYRIYRLILKHKFSAYLAALAYGLSLVPQAMSHWGKMHNAMVFFLTLSLFFIVKFEKEKNIKFFYWSLVAASLSFSSHYIGISAFIFPFCGLIVNKNNFNKLNILKSFLLSALIVSFFYLTTLKGVLSMFHNVFDNYYSKTGFTGLLPVGTWERFYYVFRDSFFVEPVFLVIFIVVFLFMFVKLFKDKYLRYVFFGILFNYFLMITIIVGPGLTRWLLVFMVLAIPLGAGVFSELLIDRFSCRMTVYFFLLLLLLPSLFFDWTWLRLLKEDTLSETSEWLRDNLQNSQVAYSFVMELTIEPSYAAALWQKESNNVLNSDKINYVLENKEKFKDRGLNLYYDYGFSRYQGLGGEDTKYVILYYWLADDEKGRSLLMTKKLENQIVEDIRRYHKLELVQTFYPTKDEELVAIGVGDYINNPLRWTTLLKLKRGGPFVDVYAVD